jgi:predicted TIM-barrel fold metal-dependent hydrolase
VASSYPGWWAVLEEYFAAFSTHEKEKIFGANAAAFYHLPTSSQQ